MTLDLGCLTKGVNGYVKSLALTRVAQRQEGGNTMSELGKQYEEMIEKEAKDKKEDALKELSAYEKEEAKRVAGGEEEPRAIAGPYSFTVNELINQVEQETKVGRDVINSVSRLKATLAKGGK